MMLFTQPCDYVHKGRNVWFNPADVIKIVASEDNYAHCIVTLRNGDAFTVDMAATVAAAHVNAALSNAQKK